MPTLLELLEREAPSIEGRVLSAMGVAFYGYVLGNRRRELLAVLRARSEAIATAVCASCVRPGERVRGCRNGRELAPCARCGQPTTGRRLDT